MDTAVLEELGLSNAEAKIYLSLLEEGPSKTGRIIDTTKMQSSTVYHVLGSLVEKGLVTYVYKGEIKYYAAERPEVFLASLDEKRRKLNDVLPELRKLQARSQKKQTAKVYEGLNGLRAAYADVLATMKKGEEYYFYQMPKDNLYNDRVIEFFKKHHTRRMLKGIKVKGLAEITSREKVSLIFDKVKLAKIRYLEESAPIGAGLVINKDKVITIDWDEEPVAFVIESKAVANTYRTMFERQWKIARK